MVLYLSDDSALLEHCIYIFLYATIKRWLHSEGFSRCKGKYITVNLHFSYNNLVCFLVMYIL